MAGGSPVASCPTQTTGTGTVGNEMKPCARALVSVVTQSSRRGRIKARTVCAMPDKYTIAPHGLVQMRDMEVFASALI